MGDVDRAFQKFAFVKGRAVAYEGDRVGGVDRAPAGLGVPEHRHTSLLRGDGGLTPIVTVWRSRDDLDRHLACVDKPFAVGLLESAGGVTVVEVLGLVLDSNTAWWP